VDLSEYPHIFEPVHRSFLSVDSSNTNEATCLMDGSSVYYTYYYLGILFSDINDGSNLCYKHTYCLLYTDFNQFWCFIIKWKSYNEHFNY